MSLIGLYIAFNDVDLKKLFYEMTVTGNVFELKLDGNPILAGAKYTLLEKPNSVKPKNGKNGKKLMKIA